MRFYLAGSFSNKAEVRMVKEQLEALGHEAFCTWVDTDGIADDAVAALRDMKEIRMSDAVVVLTAKPSTTGGYYFEAGYAAALGRRVFIVGSDSNIFLQLFPRFATLEGFVRAAMVKESRTKPSLWWL